MRESRPNVEEAKDASPIECVIHIEETFTHR